MFQSYAGVLGEERAGRGVVTGAAPVEEHDPGRVGPTFPEGELAAVGTVAVASRHHLLPAGDGLTRRRGLVEVGLAGLLGLVPRLELTLSRGTDHLEAVLVDLRVGEALDAVVTYAFGELGLGPELGHLFRGEFAARTGAGVGVVGTPSRTGARPARLRLETHPAPLRR
jgi:hypothetical protein